MSNLPKRYSKNEDYICPKCGGSDCECYDDYFEDCCIIRKMVCNDCNHQWREYFKIVYDGFSDKTGEYDADGKCIVEYEVNEDTASPYVRDLRDEDNDDENKNNE